MNIRRVRKKKTPTVNKNEEELAQDKLFEISCYCEEKFEDESKVLGTDHKQVVKENPPIRSKEFEDVIKRKRGESQANLSRLRQRKKDV